MTTIPSAPVDADTASLLALIDGDPIHERNRAKVIAAIRETAADNQGEVCPNRLRALLHDDKGQCRVYPAVIGATVYALRKRGVLVQTGWTVTEGSASGNSGKPARVHALRTP